MSPRTWIRRERNPCRKYFDVVFVRGKVFIGSDVLVRCVLVVPKIAVQLANDLWHKRRHFPYHGVHRTQTTLKVHAFSCIIWTQDCFADQVCREDCSEFVALANGSSKA